MCSECGDGLVVGTSYYGKKLGEEWLRIQVSRESVGPVHLSIEEAYPRQELLEAFKSNLVGEEEFSRKYIEETKPRIEKIAERIKIASVMTGKKKLVLLCYEKTGDFCHRHLLAGMLGEIGIEVEEV